MREMMIVSRQMLTAKDILNIETGVSLSEKIPSSMNPGRRIDECSVHVK
jgi:hypothetical protein